MSDTKTQTQTMVHSFFKDEYGAPIDLTQGQDQIFRAITLSANRALNPRVHVMCHTRYGKSQTVGLGVLTRATTFPEKWAIIAGQKEKSKIIMDYVISHIFDNDWMKDRFIPDKGESIESIRRFRNKNRLTFVTGYDGSKSLLSEVFIGSAKDALGFGAPNVIEDESALIDDNDHSLVMRMLGDNPTNNFLCKIGNPFRRNHFLKSYGDPKYRKIVVDCYQGLKEGRLTEALIEENRPYSFFKILYECYFPSANEVDESGWMYLLTDNDIQNAKNRVFEPAGIRRLGVDVARGGRNFNVWVLRTDNVAKVVRKNRTPRTDLVADETLDLMKELGVGESEVFIDDTGVGGGVTDHLLSKGVQIMPIRLGESPVFDDTCANVRAECYAGNDGLMNWVKRNGHLEDNADWMQLTQIRYRKTASSKVQIEPKEEMLKRGVESPDVADALALTFAKVKIARYYGINPTQILGGGAESEFGGVGENPYGF